MRNKKRGFVGLIILIISVLLIGVVIFVYEQKFVSKEIFDEREMYLVSTTSPKTIDTTKNFDQEKSVNPVNPISTCNLNSPNFICENITQGMEFYEPNYIPPKVCGCKPTRCPDGQAVIVSQGAGFWPDGSHKGIFVCSSEFPS